MDAFVAAVNGELRALSYRRALRAHLKESRSAAWEVYSDIAEVLSRVAEELGSLSGSDPLAERRLVRYLKSLDIDAEAAVYRDGSGRVRVVIESGRLTPLTKHPDYLERLSSVVGVRLCLPTEEDGALSRLTLLEAEPLAVSVGIAAMKKSAGRRSAATRGRISRPTRACCASSSPTGWGRATRRRATAARSSPYWKKFLRSGVDPAAAMKILNSVMLLKKSGQLGLCHGGPHVRRPFHR